MKMLRLYPLRLTITPPRCPSEENGFQCRLANGHDGKHKWWGGQYRFWPNV